MEKIYSRVQQDRVLHMIARKSDFKKGRIDIVDPHEFIQCAQLQCDAGQTFRPHKHIWKMVDAPAIAQESWCVLKGRVKCTFYDVDDTIIAEPILEAGDASFTLIGGHTYTILEDDTQILEYKTGPYHGQAADKTFIE